jgi:hypothetical protein
MTGRIDESGLASELVLEQRILAPGQALRRLRKSCRPDMLFATSASARTSKDVVIDGKKSELCERVQFAALDGRLFEENRPNSFPRLPARGSNPVASSDGGEWFFRAITAGNSPDRIRPHLADK